MEIASLAALSLGMIFVGSAHGEITPTILQTLMERETDHLDSKYAKFMCLGLALLFVGQQDENDATIETLKAIDHHPITTQAQVLVQVCSFAGTGDVLKIQQMLHMCAEHYNVDDGKKKEGEESANAGEAAQQQQGENADTETKKEGEDKKHDDTFQGLCVLGIAIIAMGEDVGSEMVVRHMTHLMHYGEPVIRRAVPLALALLHPSNPAITLLDTLSKYSHDQDLDVAINAIFAMGIVGAGTNNARMAQLLRGLASYYYKEPDCLFVVRVAQGLIHMGKGTIGLSPFHTDRQLMSRTGLAGLLSTLISFTDSRNFVLEKCHWMLYWLSLPMYPRFLITLDEDLKPLPTSVRVGKAVDVVGQAGKPRTISGFQTHTSPVRLGTFERAELASEEYLSYSHVLEGLTILTKNPGYSKEE